MAFRHDIINIPTTYVPFIDESSDAVQRSLCLDAMPVYTFDWAFRNMVTDLDANVALLPKLPSRRHCQFMYDFQGPIQVRTSFGTVKCKSPPI